MLRFVLVRWLVVGGAMIVGVGARAQKEPPTPAQRLLAARTLYYTPTTQGLRSFHCAADIPWKDFLTAAGAGDVKDDDPSLLYLKTAHLGVTDNLHGAGSLDWSNVAAPPEGKEAGLSQIKSGTQQMIGGFFQSWNTFMNGTMIPVPDASTKVTATAEGLHLHATSEGATVDQDYSKDLLLTAANVDTKEMRVEAVPHYNSTPDGFLLESLASTVKPTGGTVLHVNFAVKYQTVQGFQLPSIIGVDIKNALTFSVKLTNCSIVKGSDDGQDLLNDKGKAKLKQ